MQRSAGTEEAEFLSAQVGETVPRVEGYHVYTTRSGKERRLRDHQVGDRGRSADTAHCHRGRLELGLGLFFIYRSLVGLIAQDHDVVVVTESHQLRIGNEAYLATSTNTRRLVRRRT